MFCMFGCALAYVTLEHSNGCHGHEQILQDTEEIEVVQPPSAYNVADAA